MITLTNAQVVKAILGGTATTNYDKVVIDPITYFAVQQTIKATLTLTCSADATQPAITGSITIAAQGTPYAQIEVPSLNVYRTVPLSPAQQTTVQGWCSGSQNQVESGLVAIGAIAGAQTAGV